MQRDANLIAEMEHFSVLARSLCPALCVCVCVCACVRACVCVCVFHSFLFVRQTDKFHCIKSSQTAII